MSFGYTVMGFGAAANSSIPFAAILVEDGSSPLLVDIEHPAPAGAGAFTTGVGGVPTFDVSVVASGGSGSYTYAWTNVEVRDDNTVYSIAGAGTTNAAQYNSIGILGSTPGSAGQINPGVWTLTCTVSDGVAANIAVNVTASLNAVALP
jgi:hypothetical protein